MSEIRYCEVCGKSNLDTEIKKDSISQRVLCSKHYQRLKTNGTTERKTKKYDYDAVVGNTYGDLTVISKDISTTHSSLLCVCTCGNNVNVRIEYLFKKGRITCGKCSYNRFKVEGNFVIGYSTTTDDSFIFDLEDYERVNKHTWKIVKDRVISRINKKDIYLHKFILNHHNETIDVDHIDGNPKNNIKTNLRICSHNENMHNHKISISNTSGITGVWFDATRCKWVAEILANGKKHMKRFNNIEDAIKKRVDYEFEYFGDFRRGQLDKTNIIIKQHIEDNYKGVD